jgi:hypothetical protein
VACSCPRAEFKVLSALIHMGCRMLAPTQLGALVSADPGWRGRDPRLAHCRTRPFSQALERKTPHGAERVYRVAFRKKIYASIAELQGDLDAWIRSY